MAQSSTIIEEMTAAARGVIALVRGDRRVPNYFDFGPGGLIGSFIAFLVVLALRTAMAITYGPGGSGTALVIQMMIAFALQLGACYVVLRQLGRLDGFVPYIVVDNWATFFVTCLSVLLEFAGIGDMPLFVIFAVLGFIVFVNIARLVLTLPVGQIVLLAVAQMAALFLAAMIIWTIFPPTPEELEAIAAVASSLPA